MASSPGSGNCRAEMQGTLIFVYCSSSTTCSCWKNTFLSCFEDTEHMRAGVSLLSFLFLGITARKKLLGISKLKRHQDYNFTMVAQGVGCNTEMWLFMLHNCSPAPCKLVPASPPSSTQEPFTQLHVTGPFPVGCRMKPFWGFQEVGLGAVPSHLPYGQESRYILPAATNTALKLEITVLNRWPLSQKRPVAHISDFREKEECPCM